MKHEQFMQIAIELARQAGELGNRAVGAVVVRCGAAIGKGSSNRATTHDPAGHAEIMALRDAVETHGPDLRGAVLYCTLEPCPMCLGAIVVNRIPEVVIGLMHTDEDRFYKYSAVDVARSAGFPVHFEVGVMAAECAAIIAQYDSVHQGRGLEF